MDDRELESKVKQIVEDSLGQTVEDPETDLVDTGLINSLAIMNIAVGLEDVFGYETDVSDIVKDNFRSISSITEMVRKYL